MSSLAPPPAPGGDASGDPASRNSTAGPAGPLVSAASPTVATMLLDRLVGEGVTHIFGLPGGGIMFLLDALRSRQSELTYVVARHETGAAYMADGYYRVTGRLGVVLVTTGPGALNALTGAMNAQADRSAVLTISGEVAEHYFGMGYLQAGIDGPLDVTAIYKNAVASSALIASPDDFETLFGAAIRRATSTPRQSVHIALPVDVSSARPAVPQERIEALVRPARPLRLNDREGAETAARWLAGAERPLVMLGNGARSALRGGGLRALLDVVEAFAIPVMTSPDGKALFPEHHPLSLRNYGMAACPWTAAYMAGPSGAAHDALLVLGSSLGQLATNKWDRALVPNGPLMQVDADPSAIGRVFPVDLGIVADCASFIEDLRSAARTTAPERRVVEGRLAALAGIKARRSPWVDAAKRDLDQTPILPQAAMKAINALVPIGSHVFIDCANCVGWSLSGLAFDPPTELHLSLDMGPLGFGVCAVLGGAFGAPDRLCLAIVGDGAFLMHGSEVSTAARYRIGAVWIVLSNDDLAMVSQGNAHFFPDPPSPTWDGYYGLGSPDLAAFAAGLGADVYRVNDVAGLTSALAKAIRRAGANRRPQVVVVDIDRSEVPPYYPAVAPIRPQSTTP